ncbi:DNA-binding response regulator [Echinicola strongylocentroti]|uniref:DNA-binding response regulator n=1 Tax=Echinicola strongylocentroti TaxID=1795355 RepID=A0A2Z4IH86_9BACT|nr:LytTR family transcriptional regulator DNA-binding domain-containing protein [Echinicola strongylocentroti]AWW29838.1 DNA-binding response regulator [Echinicola strongylocentroti]
MIKTIIIDDEPLAAQLVEEYLEGFPDFKVVAICQDGFQGLKAIHQYEPDLIFLDVQMPRINGFEMLELLEHPPAVIFSTAFDEYAVKAFDNHAVDYLLKPFSQSRFEAAIKKFSLQESGASVQQLLASKGQMIQEEFASRIVLKEKGEIKVIPVNEVAFFEANDDFVNIHIKGKKYLKNRTLKFLESVLDPRKFVRVHRSYLVNIAEITSVEPYQKEGNVLRLRRGDTIPVSRSGMTKLKSVLGV